MGKEILNDMFMDMIEGLIKFFDPKSNANVFLEQLDYNNTFGCINSFTNVLGFNINSVLKVVWIYALWLLILKLIWKCFDNYMLGSNGNDEFDPMLLLVNFVKAIVCSCAFGLLFDSMVSIASEFTGKIMNIIGFGEESSVNTVLDVLKETANNLFAMIMVAVFGICVIILNIKFLVNGIELLTLRVGIAFSTMGLLDSDGGVFKPYTKKFFQICFTVLLQSVCFKCSILTTVNGHQLYGIAFLVMALKAPAFLQEFIMTSPGGGGKLQQALYSFSILRSFRKAG
ncbi:MAG: hypothetical protein HFJ06_01740 [Lachnospiraceae bacterium]|nr:hypothetical protein [Lachnospiraceae bacterium]